MHKLRREADFRCVNCKRMISACGGGTSHRNHCPYCCYSKHVDNSKGDRKSNCNSVMEPVALAYKGHGELCLVHKCRSCGKVNYNRIAADDNVFTLEQIFQSSLRFDREVVSKLEVINIHVLTGENTEGVHAQLYGIV